MARADATRITALALMLAATAVGCQKKDAVQDEWTTGKFVPKADKPAEKLEPLPRFSCKLVGKLQQWRYNPVISVLSDGRVLVAGGRQSKKWLTSSEIFDPATGRAEPTGPMKHERAEMSTVKLADGRVLVFGGGARPLELFDPKTRTWRVVGQLKQEAVGVAGVQLADGKVYIAGGELTDRREMSKQAFFWEPGSGKLSKLTELQLGLRGAAYLTAAGKIALLARAPEEEKPRLRVTDPASGSVDELKPEGIVLKALSELGRAKGDEQVALAHGSDGKLASPPTGLRGAALLRFFPSRRSWRSLAKLHHDHGSGGAVAALSPDKLLVLGGSTELESAVELCAP